MKRNNLNISLLSFTLVIPFFYRKNTYKIHRFYSVSLCKWPIDYFNAHSQKLNILSDSKGKSAIYMWTNLINKKRYVCSVNLNRRFIEYYNVNRLLQVSNMAINKGLLKYGFSNFSLEIIEYCEVENLIEREKYYFNLLKPEYNIALEVQLIKYKIDRLDRVNMIESVLKDINKELSCKL